MFDGNSWLTRKNPIAGVKAFLIAFNDNKKHPNIELVIKAMNINELSREWKDLQTIIENDSRITVINKKFNRIDSINFIDSCDCYISLHRSEGFGRIIAESMLLGKPVVVTNFSGNVDFCNLETSYLVNGELVPLKEKEYLFSEGQYWCDPDIQEAANQLICVYEDKVRRARVSEAGKRFIETHYSHESVKNEYKQRFNDILENKADR
jgi:glycosyltransferase involved in cell wall biosynthesis